MSDLTEPEIFDCLKTNLRIAIQSCSNLAAFPSQGPEYSKLRASLKLCEGACRQAAFWREDSRWLTVGLMMEEAHQRAGNWLRKRYPRPLFLKLKANLEMFLQTVGDLQNKATGRVGAILPEVGAAPTEGEVSPTLPRVTKGGIYLPPGVSV